MEIRELRSFVVAARLRSVSRAAEALDLGQPAVSAQIKKLETELRTPLFDRVRRPILLTPAGQRLAELAGPLIEALDNLSESAARADSEGPVTIVATPTLVSHFLSRALTNFRTANPHVQLRLRARLRAEAAQLVSDGQADFGIVPAPVSDPDLEFQGLFPYEWTLIAPRGHRLMSESILSLESIAAYPLVLMEPQTNTRSSVEAALHRRGLRYEVSVELNSMDMIKRYVELGYGVSIVPRVVIGPEDWETLGDVSVSHLLATESAGMIWLRGRRRPSIVESAMAVVRASTAT